MAAKANKQATLADATGLASIATTNENAAATATAAAADTNKQAVTASADEQGLTSSANEQELITNGTEQTATKGRPVTDKNLVQIRLPDNSLYTVHRNILINASPYFGRCAYSMDPTSSRNVLNMVAHITYPGVFNIWFRWLYSDKSELEYKDYMVQIPIPRPVSARGSPQAVHAPLRADLEYELLSMMYVLAFQLEDNRFQDAVLSAFVAKLQQCATPGFRALPGVRAVNDIYSFTPPKGKARTLMVKVYLVKATANDISRDFYHPEFLQDFAVGLLEGERPKQLELKECEYHRHAANEPCVPNKKRKRD